MEYLSEAPVAVTERSCGSSCSDWDTMMYLSRFGFGHSSPVMSLAVEQYMEREGHRKYELRCALRLPEAAHSEKKELQAVEGQGCKIQSNSGS